MEIKESYKIDMHTRHHILPWGNPSRRKPQRFFLIIIDLVEQVQHNLEHNQPLMTRVYTKRDPKVLIFSM